MIRSLSKSQVAIGRKGFRLTMASHRSLTTEERIKYLNMPPYVLLPNLKNAKTFIAPSLMYISGEEITNYTIDLILDQWITPHVDICNW